MFKEILPELSVIFLGILPISEVRGAIPAAILFWNFSPLKSYLLAVFGNIIPIIPLLLFFKYFVEALMRKYYFANRFFSWLFARTRKVHGDHFHSFRWAPFALFIFVAVPLPLTGAWSGVIAAIVFGIPFWYAVLSIALGVMASAGIVTALISLGIFTFNSLI